MNRRWLSSWLLFTVLSVTACGGATITAGPPWNPEDRPFFDDGVDLIENPTALAGAWGGRQKNWMEGRIQLSDVVAVVELQSLQTEVDASKSESKRLAVTVVTALYGEPPSAKIRLESRSDAPGYPLLVRHEKRMAGRFILFYRHFEQKAKDGNDAISHHFHLSPASKTLLAHVRERILLRMDAEGN